MIKKINIRPEWATLLDTLNTEDKSHVAEAMLDYVVYGRECSGLNNEAKAVWTLIKSGIDADCENQLIISERRSEAGKRHRGNQYTKNGTNGTSVPNSLKINNLEENGTNGTNGTNVPNPLIISYIHKEDNRNSDFPPTPPFNNNIYSTTTSTTTRTREIDDLKSTLIGWITNGYMLETASRIIYSSRASILASADKIKFDDMIFGDKKPNITFDDMNNEQKQIYFGDMTKSLACIFVDNDWKIKDKIQRSERSECLTYFQSWLRKYLTQIVEQIKKEKNDNQRNQITEDTAGCAIPERKYFTD